MAELPVEITRLLARANTRLRLDLEPLVRNPQIGTSPDLDQLLTEARSSKLSFEERAVRLRNAAAILLRDAGPNAVDAIDLTYPASPTLQYTLGAYAWARASQSSRERNVDISFTYYVAFWRLAQGCESLNGLANAALPFYLGLSRLMADLPFLRMASKQSAASYIRRLVEESSPALLHHLRVLLAVLLRLNPTEALRLRDMVLSDSSINGPEGSSIAGLFEGFESPRPRSEVENVSPAPVSTPAEEVRRWKESSVKFFLPVPFRATSSEDIRGRSGFARDYVSSATEAARSLLSEDAVSSFVISAIASAVAAGNGIETKGLTELAFDAYRSIVGAWAGRINAHWTRLSSVLPDLVLRDLGQAGGFLFNRSLQNLSSSELEAKSRQMISTRTTIDGNYEAAQAQLAALLSSLVDDNEEIWKERGAHYCALMVVGRFKESGWQQVREYGRAFFQLHVPTPESSGSQGEWRRTLRLMLSTVWRENPASPKIYVDGSTSPAEVLFRLREVGYPVLWSNAQQLIKETVAVAPWLGNCLRGDFRARDHLATGRAKINVYEAVWTFLEELI